MDLVTQLQEEVSALHALMWNYTGVLQRDAPPASLSGEPLLSERAANGLGAADIKTAADEPARMAEAVVSSVKRIDALAARLPPIDSDPNAQSARLAALQARNEALARELETEIANADKALAETRELYTEVTDEILLKPTTPRSN
mmetsp:Transcript_15449/g.29805  ORF Transcript_15449/g.29805 Transcript_15449/m.29805 type:complete len:145 (-) Transcript_15449:1849-2283(-)